MLLLHFASACEDDEIRSIWGEGNGEIIHELYNSNLMDEEIEATGTASAEFTILTCVYITTDE